MVKKIVAKLKNKGLLKKTVLIPAGVMVLLGGITIVSLWQAERVDPIEEDGKELMDGLKKDEEQAKKDAKREIGKEYPTLEEVERFEKTISDEDVKIEKMEKEFGAEVYQLYMDGMLLSQHEDPEVKTIKMGILKSENNKNAIKTRYNLVKGALLERRGEYMSDYVGFEKVKDLYVGYPELSFMEWGEDSEKVREDGYSSLLLGVYIYTMDEIKLSELQGQVNKLGIKLNGVGAKPRYQQGREEGKNKVDIYGNEVDLTSKNWKGIDSFGMLVDWDQFNFKDMVVYPGVVVKAEFEIPTKDVLLGSEYNREMDRFIRQPEELSLEIQNQIFKMKKVDGLGESIEFVR